MVGSYLILCGFHGWPVLCEDHGQGEEKHEQSMTHITKHHSEEKGESDDGVGSCRQTGYSQAGSHGGPPGPVKSMFMRQGSQSQPRLPASSPIIWRSQSHLAGLL